MTNLSLSCSTVVGSEEAEGRMIWGRLPGWVGASAAVRPEEHGGRQRAGLETQ